MRSKTLSLQLDRASAEGIARAVTAYAQAAYPPGGSDCSQVAHETLLDTARQINSHPGRNLAIRRRQIALLKAAINWYFSPDGPEPEIDPRPYLAILDAGKQQH